MKSACGHVEVKRPNPTITSTPGPTDHLKKSANTIIVSSYKHYTSLNLLTNILGIESPKGDIDGSQVSKVYYEDNDLERISKYCENDTLAVAQVLLRFMNLELLEEEQLIRVP